MSTAIALGRRTFTWSVVVATIAWSMGLSVLLAPLAVGAQAAGLQSGSLIKGSLPAVYYYGADGKRYVFPNEKAYRTWYANFSGVQVVTDATLASIAIGGNATYRPGVKMVKITTDPKVYAVAKGGVLRWVETEAAALALYGAAWASMVEDVPDAFFVNYTIGTSVKAAADFNKDGEVAAAVSINADKSLGVAAAPGAPTTPAAPAGPAALTATDGGSPASATVPFSATNVIFQKVKFSGSGTLTGIKVTRTGLAADTDLSNVKLYDGTTQIGTSQTLNASHQAVFTGLSIPVAGEKILTVAGDVAATGTATSGNVVTLGVEAAGDLTLASGSVGGTFPMRGGSMTLSSVAIGAATLFRGPDMPTSDNQPSPDVVDYRFTQVRIQAGSVEDITVKQIVGIQSGTATADDVKDLKLKNDTKGEVVATVPRLSSGGRVVFDNLSIVVKKGESLNLSLIATLAGGASSGRTVGFELHDGVAYTIQIVGNTYGFGITPTRNDFCATTGVTGGACQRQTVASGTLRLARAASSPSTGKIAQGGTQIPLVAVDYTVTGEPVRLTSQNWDFAFADDFACSELTSITLFDPSGAVVAGPKDCASNTVTFTDSMTVPVGTTTYSLKGNIANTAGDDGDGTADTVAATLDVSEFTAKGVNSGKATTVSTTTDVSGNTLTVQSAALKVTTAAVPIAGSIVAGVQKFGFANVDLDASSGGEDVKITEVKFTDTLGATADRVDLINLELWGDPDTSDATDTAMRLETTNTTASLATDNTITFTMKTPLRVAKNKGGRVTVRADISKSATIGATETHTFAVAAAADIASTGWTTGSAITETVAGAGQAQTIRASGTLKWEVAADSATAGPIVAGSTGVSMAKYKLTASFEDADITDVPLYLANGTTGAGTLANVARVKLYKDGTLVGNTAGYAFDNNAKVTATLTEGTLRAVKDVPLYIELKADFNPKEQAASGTQARVGVGDADSDASTWGAAGSYQVVATGRDGGSTITATTINSTGAAGGTVNGGNAFGVFDGVLTIGLDANSPIGVQTAGTGKEVLRFWATATGDEVTVYDLGFLMSGSATGGDGSGQISGTGNANLYSPDRVINYADWATADITQPLDPGASGLHVSSGENTTNDAGTDGTTGWDTILSIGAGQTKVVILVGDTTGAGGASTSKSLQARIDDEGATAAGVQWMDVELSGKDGTSCPAATVDLATGNECVVDSATYTKTLPVNGNGLTYN